MNEITQGWILQRKEKEVRTVILELLNIYRQMKGLAKESNRVEGQRGRGEHQSSVVSWKPMRRDGKLSQSS